MTMATDYCNTGIALDKINSKAEWNNTPGLSVHQQETYINSEVRQRNKILSKYPHKYVATLQPNSKIYDVEMVFADVSKIDCIPLDRAGLDLLADKKTVVIK